MVSRWPGDGVASEQAQADGVRELVNLAQVTPGHASALSAAGVVPRFEVEKIPWRVPGLDRPVILYKRFVPDGSYGQVLARPDVPPVVDADEGVWRPTRAEVEAGPAEQATASVPTPRSKSWPSWLLLLPMLAVQSVAALHLALSRPAFIDEATYGYAGGQELSHWIHGIPVANFQEWFSGAPVVYGPLDALVTSVGGLTGGRLLSLAFMLGATVLVYATGAQLFGRTAGLLAAALFSGLATVQFLSALATFDAMALCCLAGAVCLVVRAGGRTDMPSIIYSAVAAPVMLVIADAAKYAAALWDPFVFGLAVVVPVMAGLSWREGIVRGVRFAILLSFLIAGLLAIGKTKYLMGIFGSTVSRGTTGTPGMEASTVAVLRAGVSLGGVPIALAGAGVLVLCVSHPRWPRVIAGLILLLATIAPVLAQARLGTTVSLDKHVAFGALFGCVLGGYLLATVLRHRVLLIACGLALVTVLPAHDMLQAQRLYNWPKVNSAFITSLKKIVRPGQEEYLLTGLTYIPAYYVGPAVNSLQWKMDYGDDFTYQPPRSPTLQGIPAINAAIAHRKFAFIVVEPGQIANSVTISAIERYGGYRIDGFLPAPFVGGSQPCQLWIRAAQVKGSA